MGNDLAILCIGDVDFVEKKFVDWTVWFDLIPDGAHMKEGFTGGKLGFAHFTSQKREGNSLCGA